MNRHYAVAAGAGPGDYWEPNMRETVITHGEYPARRARKSVRHMPRKKRNGFTGSDQLGEQFPAAESYAHLDVAKAFTWRGNRSTRNGVFGHAILRPFFRAPSTALPTNCSAPAMHSGPVIARAPSGDACVEVAVTLR
jgi:hypothetical protein